MRSPPYTPSSNHPAHAARGTTTLSVPARPSSGTAGSPRTPSTCLTLYGVLTWSLLFSCCSLQSPEVTNPAASTPCSSSPSSHWGTSLTHPPCPAGGHLRGAQDSHCLLHGAWAVKRVLMNSFESCHLLEIYIYFILYMFIPYLISKRI